MINPNTLLSEEEIAILRDSKDWRNYLAIFNIWAQIALGFIIFSFLRGDFFLPSTVAVEREQR